MQLINKLMQHNNSHVHQRRGIMPGCPAILGTPGGSRIITMVLLGSLEAMQGEPVERWVSRPRFHHQYLPDHIQVEAAAFSEEQERALQAMGHRIEPVGRDYGNMQAVSWNKDSNQLSAASDPRGIGAASVREQAVLTPSE